MAESTLQYDDSHRHFVQSLMSYHILDELKALQIHEQVCDLANVEKGDFALFLGQINHRLNEFGYALRRSHDQETGGAVIAFVNTKPDDIAQLATRYDTNQIGYFRRLIEVIVMADDERFYVRSNTAFGLGQRMEPTMTSKAVEEILDQLVKDEWLVERSGSYTLSTRCLLELAGYLQEQFPGAIKHCHLCSDLVTIGERCQSQPCNTRIHRHCAQQLFDANRQALRCPVCQIPWARESTIGLGSS